jgi:hypothetical protein
MAVQPEYIIDVTGGYYRTAQRNRPTHVAFAIDDLPELAHDICRAIDDSGAYVFCWLHTTVLDCLRGTTANSGAVDDGPVQH